MNTCGKCRFKGERVGDSRTFFECQRIKHDENEDLKRGSRAVVVDGSGYFAALRVEDDFGCVLWEPSE